MADPKPDAPLIPPSSSSPSSSRNLPNCKNSIKLKYVKLGYHILITHGMYHFLSPLAVITLPRFQHFLLRIFMIFGSISSTT
ncbi:hypothetical protein ACFX13_027978 [Malus domestica]